MVGGILKVSKKVLAFLCALSLLTGLAFAQALPDESTLPIDDAATALPAADAMAQGGASTVWVFFRMIFVLIAVVVCIYFVMNFMRKKMGGGSIDGDDMFLRKVAQVSLAPGKSVQIVTLLERAYLIGVTDNSIDLIGEITDKELVDAMNLNADKSQKNARARNFSDVLAMFLNPKNPGATEGERNASSTLSDFFKKQKEKFGNEK